VEKSINKNGGNLGRRDGSPGAQASGQRVIKINDLLALLLLKRINDLPIVLHAHNGPALGQSFV